jgi:hypothetical protein
MQQNKLSCINNVQKFLKKPLQYNATNVILFSATRQNGLKLHYTLKRKENEQKGARNE